MRFIPCPKCEASVLDDEAACYSCGAMMDGSEPPKKVAPTMPAQAPTTATLAAAPSATGPSVKAQAITWAVGLLVLSGLFAGLAMWARSRHPEVAQAGYIDASRPPPPTYEKSAEPEPMRPARYFLQRETFACPAEAALDRVIELRAAQIPESDLVREALLLGCRVLTPGGAEVRRISGFSTIEFYHQGRAWWTTSSMLRTES